jgi:hypothetical protein
VGLIVDAEGGAALRDLIESGKVKALRDPADRTGGFAMLATRAADYIDAQRARVRMQAELEHLLSRFDAVVAPGRGRGAAGGGPASPRDDPRRQPRGPARDRGADRPRRGRPAHVHAAPGPRVLGDDARRAGGHRQRPLLAKARGVRS